MQMVRDREKMMVSENLTGYDRYSIRSLARKFWIEDDTQAEEKLCICTPHIALGLEVL